MEAKRQLHVLELHLAKNKYMVGDDYTNDVQDWWNNSLGFEVDYAGDMDFVGVCPLPVQGIQVKAV